ncbi:Hypothetical Protein FCC1311_068892 [Hondaea fermentalgiana]|uniref:Uncharacterized protein n=1 Tax=Hondaea fermentalgiana TaxID=2315210 RepID=A0A2R5GK19_9STRA|nr:Hypothetical Protein FCC1311_068892 [Hondaea fermentalgiana]|eukprot:GBG30669.1 Hypothetical Protein FCC1311_068892 [Hondaea fermentalgiana]
MARGLRQQRDAHNATQRNTTQRKAYDYPHFATLSFPASQPEDDALVHTKNVVAQHSRPAVKGVVKTDDFRGVDAANSAEQNLKGGMAL